MAVVQLPNALDELRSRTKRFSGLIDVDSPESLITDHNRVLGRTEPRLWTPPLRELTPETSFGFDVIDFARDVLGTPLDPWQEWAVVHLGELLPDGRPRFRVVLILVARQNGKTLLSKVLALYWMFVCEVPLVLGTSTNRVYARMVWEQLCEQAQNTPLLAAKLAAVPVRKQIGEEALTTAADANYRFAASNRRAGRSLTVHRLILDEIREHASWDCWNAATKAGNAVPDFQCIAISNQGDNSSVVLDALRKPAVEFIETGQGDSRLGIFEWSSPPGSDPTDLQALAFPNPNLGRRIDPDALVGDALRAKKAGGEELTGFRTEVMCQRVHLLNPAIDPNCWDAGTTAQPVDLAEHRQHVAMAFDVALDGSHATAVVAAVLDGQVHVEVAAAWSGFGCTKALRAELPELVRKIRPRAVGWFPAGPAAAVAADLADHGHRSWPPPRVKVEEIRGDVAQVCMGLAELVKSGELVHPDDDLLNQHVSQSQPLWRGDAWVFGRKGSGPIDGTYALAGAVHLARTLPPAPPPLEVVT